MKTLQELVGRRITWVEIDYDAQDNRYVYHYSGTIIFIGLHDAIIQTDDNKRRPLGLYELPMWLKDSEPRLSYIVACHFGKLRRQTRLADRTPHDIYALIDPRDNAVRYVGMSKQVGLRYNQHYFCSGDNEYKNAWISELRGQGLAPELEILEHVDGRYYALRREQYWIQHYLEQGALLTNFDISWLEEYAMSRSEGVS